MVIADQNMTSSSSSSSSDGKVWGFCKLPFLQSGTTISSNNTTSSAHTSTYHHSSTVEGSNSQSSSSVSSVAKSLIPTLRRLKLDPTSKLYFPCEPGKQVRSAIRIKNKSKSYVAFKFQTTAPKSCFMRPPGAILAPGKSIIATVFKFVELLEQNEKLVDQKSKAKFKIMSLKVKGPMDYVPELFDEQKDQVAIERILRVIFLDPEHPSSKLEKLKRQLAEADAEDEAHKKPPEVADPKIIGEGLVIDEWKERRERYLARQQDEGLDSL